MLWSAESPPPDLAFARGVREDVPPAADWMADGELDVVRAFRLEHRRQAWILGRWTAKRAVMTWADDKGDPRRWAILAAADGAPEAFHDGDRQPVSVSLSHRSGRAIAVTVGDPRVAGCYLERIEPRTNVFLEDFLVESERAWVLAGPDRDLRANLAWSAKECALKILRVGLRRDTRSVVARIGEAGPEESWGPFEVLDAGVQPIVQGWWRRSGDFVETVALATGELRP